MNKKAFSLIEMAIVLVIFGLILASASSVLTLFVNKGGAERTRKMIESDKSSLYSYVTGNKQLPNSMSTVVTYPTDAYNKNFYYFSDTILNKTISGWNLNQPGMSDVNAICGAYYTNIQVQVCTNASCSSHNDVNNVAFVIASGGDNKNIQTSAVLSSGTYVVKVYPQGADAKDDYTTDMNRTEKYDDIVDWVTLDELRNKAGCGAERFSYLNTTMPAMLEGSLYSFNFYVTGGVPFAYYNSSSSQYQPEYMWKVDDRGGLDSSLTSPLPADPTVGIFTVRHADGSVAGKLTTTTDEVQGAYLQLAGNSTSFDQSSYTITITVTDKASALGSTSKPYTKRFMVNAQYKAAE